MPQTAHVISEVDERGQPVLRCYTKDSPNPLWFHLLHPQLVEVRKRDLVFRGYCREQGGQLFAQAWEVEPVVR